MNELFKLLLYVHINEKSTTPTWKNKNVKSKIKIWWRCEKQNNANTAVKHENEDHTQVKTTIKRQCEWTVLYATVKFSQQ